MKRLVVTEPYKMVFEEVPVPEIATDTEVLVKVKAVGICGSDIKIYHGQNTFATYPRVLGHEAVGEVVKIGNGVTKLAIGDRVVLEPIVFCGKCYACRRGRGNVCHHLQIRGINIDGGYQEYIVADQVKLHKFPATITWKEAVMMEPYTLGAQVAARSNVQKDDIVFISGMGPAGQVVLDTFHTMGVEKIIVSDMIPKRLELAKELGAITIDFSKEDVKSRLMELTDGEGPNVTIDAAGSPKTFEQAIEVTSQAGTVVPMGYTDAPASVPTVRIGRKELTVVGSRLEINKFPGVIADYPKHLDQINRLISHVYPFSRAQEAMNMACSGRDDLGKVVIMLEDEKE